MRHSRRACDRGLSLLLVRLVMIGQRNDGACRSVEPIGCRLCRAHGPAHLGNHDKRRCSGHVVGSLTGTAGSMGWDAGRRRKAGPRVAARNVVDHLPEEHRAEVKRKLRNAYAMVEYHDAKRALQNLLRELMHLNPSAARSLEEGLEETLTVHRLRVPDQLRRTLSSTNVIESAFSIVETVCRNVKRWQSGDQIERWVGSGLLVAERQFRRVVGHRQIPLLLSSMANAVSKKSIAKGVAVA